MSRIENSPLLSPHPTNELLPPLRTPQVYGIIEVGTVPSSSKKIQQNGIISNNVCIPIVALAVAAILIFGFATVLKGGDEVQIPQPLMQAAPDQTSYVDLQIPQGELRGYHRKSRQGRDYTAFYKVPYAASPVGKLRFRDPQPAQPWNGLRDIKEVALQCIQKEKYSDVIHTVGDEDCLYANIYVPGLSPEEHASNLLPTMVYIHGGGFVDGNGSRYGTEYFMDEDVVVVTFQYRLGPLGFINTEDGVIRGNMGLKDQVEMLRWATDNIKYFGGDPDLVTIYGNSGGGISVSFLMISPLSNGLFHRAISQSGGGLCGSVGDQTDANPRKTVEEVGRVLNCPTEDSQRFLECLESKDASEIALVRTPPTVYALTVERTNDTNVFMPKRPYEMLESGWVNKVPYMVGVVNAEWLGRALGVLYDADQVQELNKDSAAFNDITGLNISSVELENMRKLYFGEREIGNDTIAEMAYLLSDQSMIHCSYVGAKMHGKYSPAYLYHITKPPYKSYVEKPYPGFPAKQMGLVHHADELQYLFLYDGYPEIPVGDEEYYEYSKYLVSLWAHFAKTGNPSMSGSTWNTVDSDSSPFWFELGDKSGRTDALQERMSFWDRFSHKTLLYT